MNSSENLNLNAQTVVKRPTTKHASNAIQRSFPSRSGALSTLTHDWNILGVIQELHDKLQTHFRFRWNCPLR